MTIKLPKSLLWISESTAETLLKFYDYPHPKKTGEIIEGYDKTHALRSAKMCAPGNLAPQKPHRTALDLI